MSRNWDRETFAVLASALDVAGAAPLHQGQAFAAKIPWRMIHRLRTDLEGLGVDWRSFAAEYQANVEATGRAIAAERDAFNRARNLGTATYSQPAGDPAE